MKQIAETDFSPDKLILAGNPNVGKSVIFSHLTGNYVVISNYSGTTVELSSGILKPSEKEIDVIDTPGVESLLPKSEDEMVALDILLSEDSASVIQVINSLNLKRGLFLTAQLLMMDVPLVIDLNIVDEARSRGIEIDKKKLSMLLGVDVVETVATRREGIKELKKLSLKPKKGSWKPVFQKPVEDALSEIEKLLPAATPKKRFISLLALVNGDFSQFPKLNTLFTELLDESAEKRVEDLRANLQKTYSGELLQQINNQIYKNIAEIVDSTRKLRPVSGNRVKDFISNMMIHPVWGVPILLTILWLTYMIVGKFGAGDLVDFLQDGVFDKYLTPFVTRIVELFTAGGLMHELLVGEFGLWTMGMKYALAIVLPIVGLFFLLFGVLEDSGYLPRLAIMLNRPFKFMGLSGRAVLPMVLGLGCATMATLTARILNNKKERIIVTLLLALAIPCSAQLGVIMGMLGILSGGAILWWAGSVVIVLLIVGKLSSIILPGENSIFIQEISPLRTPQPRNLLVKTWARIRWYLKEAVPLFLLGTLILFILHRTGAIEAVENLAEPVLNGLMGLPKEAASAFVMGFLRRDYAATGLFDLANQGMLTPVQTLVSLVAITLFMPCIANLLIIIKERGWKTALWMSLFIVPFAIGFAAVLNLVLQLLGITFT